jgi:Tfp pilus assembly protein PilO
MKILTPIALILASVGLFYLVIMPQYHDLSDTRSKIQQYSDAISRAQEVVSKRDKLLAQKNSFSPDDIRRLQKMLPDKVDPIRFVIDVNNIAASYGTKITDIKIGTEIGSKTNYDDTTMSFTAPMSYDQVQKFLADVERSLQLVDVSGLGFKSEDKSSIYTYSFTLKTYSLK